MQIKKGTINKRILIAILIVAVLFAAFIFVFFQVKKKNILLNPLFIKKTDTIGVDISNHQGDVDMELLGSQGVSFVYMKATEGSSFVDPEFAKNWENAEKAGIPSGAYHFFSFDSKGKDQANRFIQTVGEMSGRLLPVVDVEFYADKRENPPKKEDVVRELKEYLQIVEKECGVKPMIYMSADIYESYLQGEFEEYPKWVSSVYYPLRLDYHGDWVLWQYTDRGKLAGTNGPEKYIDLDVLNKKTPLESLLIP